ncbi:hypothetical protein Pla144_46150 [Bythopirellula polymerisocia]|uniref:Uncharacterized protein n=1 Tax=Bythopirellula polymerisocia TaxID=2528003 RepID=A0A5C6CD43_9BACT|nr:hypothetical protein Pla144_46150 [Bythopirellula polymerisocia]
MVRGHIVRRNYVLPNFPGPVYARKWLVHLFRLLQAGFATLMTQVGTYKDVREQSIGMCYFFRQSPFGVPVRKGKEVSGPRPVR